MTNKEALVAVVLVDANDNLLEKALADGSITSTDNYSPENSQAVDSAAISVLRSILSMPDITEGGYSIRYDRASIQKRIDALAANVGIDNGPVIRDASDRW
jgi:hypothetical protein